MARAHKETHNEGSIKELNKNVKTTKDLAGVIGHKNETNPKTDYDKFEKC